MEGFCCGGGLSVRRSYSAASICLYVTAPTWLQLLPAMWQNALSLLSNRSSSDLFTPVPVYRATAVENNWKIMIEITTATKHE